MRVRFQGDGNFDKEIVMENTTKVKWTRIDTNCPVLTIIAIILLASTVDWLADVFFSFFGG